MTDPKARAEEISAELAACFRQQGLDRIAELLDELQTLAGQNPANDAVATVLALWLSHELDSALAMDDRDGQDDLLTRLRELAAARPGHGYAQGRYAAALHRASAHARFADEPGRRDDLHGELHAFALRQLDHADIRKMLANSLMLRSSDAPTENEPHERGRFVKELRRLAGLHPDDAMISGQLSVALVNLSIQAAQDGATGHVDGILDELRSLAAAHPADSEIVESLATGLFNATLGASQMDDLSRSAEMLDELRSLAEAHPGNPGVVLQLAQGLCNASIHVRKTNDPAGHDRLLGELRELAEKAPPAPGVLEELVQMTATLTESWPEFDDPEYWRKVGDLNDRQARTAQARENQTALQVSLARALLSALKDAVGDGRDRLSEELKHLCRSHKQVSLYVEAETDLILDALPDGNGKDGLPESLHWLADMVPEPPDEALSRSEALVSAIDDANLDDDRMTRDRLLAEFRSLVDENCNAPELRRLFAFSLHHSIHDAWERGHDEDRQRLDDELQALVRAHRDEDWIAHLMAAGFKSRGPSAG